jgi:translation initiation factor IF-3
MNKRIVNNKRKHKINDDIKSFEVRLIVTGAAPEIMKTKDALKLADEEGKDLILINENQEPPIVKIEDYGKFLYNIEKMLKEQKKNAVKSELREIKLSCEISDHDLEIKAKKGKEFLQDGDKVKCVIQLKGRQKGNPERGQLVMLKFATLLEDYGSAENVPKLESSKWLMILKPKKKN